MPATLYITKDERRRMVAMHKAGASFAAIAKAFGRTPTNTKRAIVDPPAPRRVVTEEAREQMIALRAEGLTLTQIQAATGWGEATVVQVMRDARAEGDERADPDPGVRVLAARARAAGAVEVPPSPAAPADPMVASLILRGLTLPQAVETVKAYRKARETRPVAAERVVTGPRKFQGPFRLGLHAHNMEQS